MGLLGTMSAVGTALGPSLGGVADRRLGWRAIFLVNVPLGVLAFVLARRHLPADRRDPRPVGARFDPRARCCSPLTLAAYALAMTSGAAGSARSTWPCWAPPRSASACSSASSGAASPLIRLTMFRDRCSARASRRARSSRR